MNWNCFPQLGGKEDELEHVGSDGDEAKKDQGAELEQVIDGETKFYLINSPLKKASPTTPFMIYYKITLVIYGLVPKMVWIGIMVMS